MRFAIPTILVAAVISLAVTTPLHADSATRATSTSQCDRQHPAACARAIAYWKREAARARAAVAWQQHDKATQVRRVLAQARGKQPFSYAARLAYLACQSFSATPARCRPPTEMLGVCRCESGLQSHDPNHSGSTADGWCQFLSSTWNNAPAGREGWSRYDVLAMGIATAALVTRDGSWREWSCGYAA